MNKPVLGNIEVAGEEFYVPIDVRRLVETRLVITAISGGGKSHAIRRILEQTHGQIQHIVLDPEGEFYTLREKFPYVLAGKGGDCPAEPRSAELLATKLLELRVSAIIDLYELRPDQRVLFVKLFIDSLLNAPKNLRHPCIVVIDEAHSYAPEKGEGEAISRNSVVALMAQGRKRLLCPILATQRLSKLDKNAISEAHNMMIGKSILDIDVNRAMRYLGFEKRSEERIRHLKRGHFWTFGPAFSDEVIDILVGDTVTNTPKLGSCTTAPPPPSKDIQRILGQLSDLPEEAEKKEQTEKELRAEIAELKRAIKHAPAIKFATPEPTVISVSKPVLTDKQIKSLLSCTERLEKLHKSVEARSDALVESVKLLRDSILTAVDVVRDEAKPKQALVSNIRVQPIVKVTSIKPINKPAIVKPTAKSDDQSDGKLSLCARKILGVLAQFPEEGCTSGKLTLLSGYRYSGGFKNSLSELRANNFMTGDNTGVMKITQEGIDAAGHIEPLPVGEELFKYWRNHPSFGVCEQAILDVLHDHGEIENGTKLAEATGRYAYSGGFKNSLSNLRTAGIITGKSNTEPISLNPDLFG